MRLARLALAFVLTMFVTAAMAQPYPARGIRLIVDTSPGGLTDLLARLSAETLSARLGQPVVVENKPGASGNVAADLLIRSPADGYTLMVAAAGNLAVRPFLERSVPFDPLTDLVPVAPLTSSPVVVAISAKIPASNLDEFIALARREPGKLNYGSAGPGTIPHLAGELFSQSANVKLTAVHYRGAGPALTDLLAGQVQAIFVGLGVVRAHMAAGTVRVLAVSQPQRLQGAPEIPTAAEAGLAAFELNTWFGIVVPKGTPERIVATLVRQIHAMQDDPLVQKRLSEGGLDVLKESPAQFRARMLRDHERFREIVKTAGLKPE